MSSSSDIFQQVRAAVDIVEVIGEHIALKRAGKEFKGLCPFHDDRNPSMHVVPTKQIYKCFSCGAVGDVFKFVTEYHKMTKGEALRMLAQRAGIKLPELPRSGRSGPQTEGPSIREQIAATNEWACAFFEKNLGSAQGKTGLDYFHARGLTNETIEKFRLGFAIDSWTGLVNTALKSQAHPLKPEQLFDAGLIKKRADSSPYDVFRNRVMFPIIDASASAGRVIAFGGRVLAEKRDENGAVVEAKYLNTPETRLFNKSESMYGLNHARQHIIRTRTAVVVEGYMDVIAAHQAGVTNVIATLGTALTQEHARILKNYAQTIVLLFDSDDAGFRAADRAMDVFVRGTLEIKLASVPDGKDPCDFCMKNGGEAFQKLVDNSVDALTYQWERLGKQFRATESLTARQEAVTQFLRFAAAAMESGEANGAAHAIDPIRRGLLLSKIAKLVGMQVDDVSTTLKRLARAGAPVMRPPIVAPSVQVEPASDEQSSSLSEPPTPVPPIDLRTLKGLDAAEGWLLGALLAQPPLYEKFRDDLSLNLFLCLRPLAGTLIEYFDHHPDLTACSLAELVGTLEEQDAIRQAVELERKISQWLDPTQLSPAHVKLLLQLTDDRGMTLETLVADSLRELQNARGATDPIADADLELAVSATPSVEESAAPSDEDSLRAFMQVTQKRNEQGGNPRNTGIRT